jgi:hypothetical protein
MPKFLEGRIALGGLAAIFVWTFVVLPILYYPTSKSPHDNQRTTNSQQEPYNVSNEPPALIALKLFTSAGRNEIAKYCGRNTKETPSDWTQNYICDVKITDAYIAFFNGLLVVVTVGLIVVGYLTIRKMRDTEERQLRAYVFADAGPLEKGANNVWRYVINYRNSGQTPAYEFTQYTQAGIFDEPAPENTFAIVLRQLGRNSKAPLPPNQRDTVSATNTFNVTPAEISDIRAGRKAFYVWGEIQYRDAFKRRRTVRFRFVHDKHCGPTHLIYNELGNEESEN